MFKFKIKNNSNSDKEIKKKEYNYINLENWKHAVLFLISFLLIKFLSVIFLKLTLAFNPYYISTSDVSMYLNFTLYFVLFGIMLIIIGQDLLKFITKFKNKDTYTKAVKYLVISFSISIVLSYINSIIFNNNNVNDNEEIVRKIIVKNPFLSLLIIGIIGPFTEECAYRVGLFTLIRKKSRFFAYVISSIVFGFIHFNFNSENMLNEILNIPSYVISGFIFSYVYEKFGFETSFVMHAFNNSFAILATLLNNNG